LLPADQMRLVHDELERLERLKIGPVGGAEHEGICVPSGEFFKCNVNYKH
jgi:hypothetical protein